MHILMDGETPIILGILAGIAPGTPAGTGPGILDTMDGTVPGTMDGDGPRIMDIGAALMAGGAITGIITGDGDITMLIGDGPEVTIIMERVDTIHRITATMSAVTQVVTVQDWQPTAMDAHVSMAGTVAATASPLVVPMAIVPLV